LTLSRSTIEVGIAALIAIVILVIQPGVAVGGVLALVLLAVLGATLLPRWRSHRRAAPRNRPRRR
jgi:predicted membrane metal-binding protein